MWGGRFQGETDERMWRFNASIRFDWRLWRADIQGSRAWARGLAKSGLISQAEEAQLLQGLEMVAAEFAAERFAFQAGDEDIHTAVERRLGELVGRDVAGKLHTGRSRNDQVATDLRLFVQEAVGQVQGYLRALQQALVDQAQAHLDVLMPGYTHVQRAQPVLFSHWLMAYFQMFRRDAARFEQIVAGSTLPLGSGALAGNALGMDRDFLAQALGFGSVSQNSMDGVSDRDFVVEFLFAAALCQVHLSRMAEDLILYSSAEFGFVEIDDKYATGSSLMPQKKNADSLELLRGKTGRLVGRLTGFLTVLKGLPMTYNKDLQEDKEPLFDALDTLELALPVAAGVISTLKVKPERMAAALDDGMLTTDLADYLVRKGLPFREAHAVVGRVVRLGLEMDAALRDLPLVAYQRLSPLFEEDLYRVFNFQASVAQRDVTGGTARSAVERQIAAAREEMARNMS
ncbi:MAG: argininosuccinate lyase [Chloroflexi bacterium]|nr:argininosuccinate lyase [Chloroflexota bacterium]